MVIWGQTKHGDGTVSVAFKGKKGTLSIPITSPLPASLSTEGALWHVRDALISAKDNVEDWIDEVHREKEAAG